MEIPSAKMSQALRCHGGYPIIITRTPPFLSIKNHINNATRLIPDGFSSIFIYVPICRGTHCMLLNLLPAQSSIQLSVCGTYEYMYYLMLACTLSTFDMCGVPKACDERKYIIQHTHTQQYPHRFLRSGNFHRTSDSLSP